MFNLPKVQSSSRADDQMRASAYAPMLLLGLLPSCAVFSPRDIAEPSTITVETAMGDVGKGFEAMRKAVNEGSGEKIGYYACLLGINFNVAASADQSRGLVLDANIKAPSTVVDAGGALKYTAQDTAAASRGNVVNSTLENPLCTILKGVVIGKTTTVTVIKDGAKETTTTVTKEVTPQEVTQMISAIVGGAATFQ
jgi:hypothetical protein